MYQTSNERPDEAEVDIGRVRAALEQIPIAAFVTVANATLLAGMLLATESAGGIYAWLAAAIVVSLGRLALWWVHRRIGSKPGQYRLWALASTSSALTAGLLWGVGSVLLFPTSDIDQMMWVFLIGGMCAGAASLHYPHLPTAIAFIVPAALPLSIRFALDGSTRLAGFAAMIVVFLAALMITSRRSSRYFGETLRLRVDVAKRTRELEAANQRLQAEIAEHQATEASLRHAQKMEAVGQLTGAIAHDFNNLLTAVLGSLTLLRNSLPADDERAARLLATASQGAERGAALTQRLLAFGRRQALMPEVVDLPKLINGMSALLNSSLGAGVNVVMRFPRFVGPVEIDANQLELAILNLAVNARDAMPQGGDITITARHEEERLRAADGLPPGAYVVLSVIDTGQGMDETTLAHAMEPFFTTKGVGRGTGLGLSMVHGFAAQSGGRFLLHSERGVGTRAELWLPRARAVAAPRPPARETQNAPHRQHGTVLVVDDDPLVLTSTAAMLEDLGYATIEAIAGQQALDRLRQDARVDLVITDYAMPGMTGIQLADELHRIRPRLPVLLMTGHADVQGSVLGGIERLAKPLRQETLAKALESHLAKTAEAVRPVS
jgi:signal transduction histidine kinase/ActR/RegA family two-component response regulator